MTVHLLPLPTRLGRLRAVIERARRRARRRRRRYAAGVLIAVAAGGGIASLADGPRHGGRVSLPPAGDAQPALEKTATRAPRGIYAVLAARPFPSSSLPPGIHLRLLPAYHRTSIVGWRIYRRKDNPGRDAESLVVTNWVDDTRFRANLRATPSNGFLRDVPWVAPYPMTAFEANVGTTHRLRDCGDGRRPCYVLGIHARVDKLEVDLIVGFIHHNDPFPAGTRQLVGAATSYLVATEQRLHMRCRKSHRIPPVRPAYSIRGPRSVTPPVASERDAVRA